MNATNLREQLNARVRDLSRDDVLERMGYSPVCRASRDRLDKVLAENTLGLEGNDYDVKYESRGFLKALCEAVGIDYDEHEAEVEAIQERLKAERDAFQPYLFADTEFTRSDRPGMAVFILAALESKRNLRLSRQSRLAPREKVIEEGAERAQSHYRETGGELPVWGTIHRYLLFLAPGESLVIDTDGTIRGEGPRHAPSRAGMAI